MSPLTEPTRIVLKNYNTPAAIAGVAPTLDYRFALDRRELDAVSLTDKLTVTRAATAAVNGSTGYLELAGPNVARFDHNLTTHQSLGLLVEEQRTNLLLQSSTLDAFILAGITSKTSNAGIAPDGTNTAVLGATIFNGLDSHLRYSTAQAINTTYTYSFFAKPRTVNYAIVYNIAKNGVGLTWFNVANGTIGTTASGVTPFIDKYSNGWHRVGVTLTTDATITNNLVDIRWGPSDNVTSTTAGENILIWGAQLEEGSFPTSYIPTTNSAVPRAESATINGTGVITGTYTMVEKPAGCAVVNGTNIDLQPGYTAEHVMVFPAALSSEQITAIRSVM